MCPSLSRRKAEIMASYHFSAQLIGRSAGRSAVAAAAYRAGENLSRWETGERHDYRRKGGIAGTTIFAPADAPEWALDRAELWNRVEAKEKRKNSQLAREFELALPHELTPAQQRKLIGAWVENELVSRGMIVDVAIHDPDPGEHGNRNVHAHLLSTTRELDSSQPDGWAKNKNRDWNSDELLRDLRRSWAEFQNGALVMAGTRDQVDHRSLKDQRAEAIAAGDELAAEILDRPPEPRLGVAASMIEKRARRRAERRGELYQPVTERSRDLARARGLRARMVAAFSEARVAIREIFEARRELEAQPPQKQGEARLLGTGQRSGPKQAREDPGPGSDGPSF